MNLQQKFDYKPLERIDHPDGRRYVVNGQELASVTTILSKTKDMSYLTEWRNAIGETEANRIVTESSNLGSNIHNLLEDYIRGKEMKGQYMALTLAKLIIKKGLCNVDEIWGAEVSLYSEGLFAGTTDLVGLHNGIPAIMDYKNSRQEKTKEMIEDYRCQLAGYALAHDEMYGTCIRKGVLMIAIRNGRYQEFIFDGPEFDKCIDSWLRRLDQFYSM